MNNPFGRVAGPFFTMPRAALVVIVASFGALAFAFTMQYGFDIEPCVLCLWQRVPFAVAGLLAIASLVGRDQRHAHALLALCSLMFLINTGLAIFHTGVEQHWWEGTRGCHITPLHGTDVQDWKQQIMDIAPGHCDQIAWTFLGLSMANWNVLYSLVLAAFASGAAFCRGRKS